MSPNDKKFLSYLLGPLLIETVEQASYQGVPEKGLRALERLGLVRVERVLAAKPYPLYKPMVTWEPGDPPPPLKLVEKLLKGRHIGRIQDEVRVVVARQKACNLFGGTRWKSRCPFAVGHALGVTEMILTRELTKSARIIREAEIKKLHSGKFEAYMPDAAVVDDDGQIVMVLEYGGDYDYARLVAMHEACAKAGIPWEIW